MPAEVVGVKYDWLKEERESRPEPPEGTPVAEYGSEFREDPEAFAEKLRDGRYDIDEVFEQFGQALQSEDPGARRVAAESFRHLAETMPEEIDDDVDFFVQFLNDSNVWVIREVIAAIDAMAEVNPDAFSSEVMGLSNFADPEIEHEIRVHAMSTIASIVDSNPFDYSFTESEIKEGLDDPYPSIRAEALRALTSAIQADKESAGDHVDRYLEALDSDHPDERAAAALGLTAVAPEDREAVRPAVADVVEMARSEDPAERDDAVHALYWLALPHPEAVTDALDRLTELVGDEDVPDPVRQSAAGAIIHVTDALGAVEGLPVEATVDLLDLEGELAEVAAIAAGNVAAEDPERFEAAVDPLVERFEEADPQRTEPLNNEAYALGYLAEARPDAVRSVVDDVVENARSGDPDRRRIGARELAGIAEGAPGVVVDALGIDRTADDPDDVLGDNEEAARCRALLAREVPAYAAESVVLAMPEEQGDVADQYLNMRALQRVAAVNPDPLRPLAEPTAQGLGEADDDSVRAEMVRFLGYLGTDEAREAVEERTDAYARVVRDAAEEALELIEEGPDDTDADAGVDETPGEETADAESDEERIERVLTVLAENDGRMAESEIVEQTGFDGEWVAEVLEVMDDEGAVERTRIGEENVVELIPEGSTDAEADAAGEADPDDLFEMVAASTTMADDLGYDVGEEAALCFSEVDPDEFEATAEEVLAILEDEDLGAETRLDEDDHGHQWVVFRDSDFEDLVRNVHFVADTFVDHQYGDQLLAALFAFRKGDTDAYWVYSFRRGSYYPFAPADPDERRRDVSVEFELENVLEGELDVENDRKYWHPLWPGEAGRHPWESEPTGADDEPGDEEHEPTEADDEPGDEEQVVALLEDHYGQLNESRIVAETGWGTDRVADVLSAMDEAGTVDRVALGDDYVVTLPPEDERGDEPAERPDAVELAAAIGDPEPARLLAPVVELADDAGRVRTEAVVEEVGRDGWDSLVEGGYLREDGDEAVVSLPAGIDYEFPDA